MMKMIMMRVGFMLKVTKEVIKSLTKWRKRKILIYKEEFFELLLLKNRMIIMRMKDAYFQHGKMKHCTLQAKVQVHIEQE